MKSIERIIVVIDANEDYSAAPDGLPIELRKALRLVVDKNFTEIKLISVGYQRYLANDFGTIGYNYNQLRREYCAKLAQAMEELVSGLTADGYRISCEVGWAHPRYELIVKMAQEFQADLLIQHCRAHGYLKHYHLTHDSWELVRQCPVPLMLVKDQDWNDHLKLMIAVDPLHSHNKPLQLDKKLITTASNLAEQAGGECHIVHAYAETARPFAPAEKIRREHEAAFRDLVAEFNYPESQLHLIDKSPVDALHDYGEEIDSDLVVMGAISRSRLKEAFIGSTAESVLDYVKTDILIVKPDDA